LAIVAVPKQGSYLGVLKPGEAHWRLSREREKSREDRVGNVVQIFTQGLSYFRFLVQYGQSAI
jgi:hypothetical protein